MSDLENQEFRECAAEFLSSQPNYSPFNDWFYTLDMDQVRDLLARAMRMAHDATFRRYVHDMPNALSRADVASRISSRIKGEKS